MPGNPLHAQIHIAKAQLRLDDEAYRAILKRTTGQASSSGLNDRQRRAALKEFRRLGFSTRPKANTDRYRPTSDKLYVRKIFAIWGELKRTGVWRDRRRISLLHFVEKMTGVADPDWLEEAQASDVIEALKAMKRRGKNSDA